MSQAAAVGAAAGSWGNEVQALPMHAGMRQGPQSLPQVDAAVGTVQAGPCQVALAKLLHAGQRLQHLE